MIQKLKALFSKAPEKATDQISRLEVEMVKTIEVNKAKLGVEYKNLKGNVVELTKKNENGSAVAKVFSSKAGVRWQRKLLPANYKLLAI